MGLELVHLAVEEVDALVEGAEETVLLLLDHAGDELALGWQLGIGSAHLLDQDIDEAEHKGLFLTEEGVGVADGTAQDAADDVASLGVARQLAVGDGESHGAQMVGHHTHGDIDLPFSVAPSSSVLLGVVNPYFRPERFSISLMMGWKMSVS